MLFFVWFCLGRIGDLANWLLDVRFSSEVCWHSKLVFLENRLWKAGLSREVRSVAISPLWPDAVLYEFLDILRIFSPTQGLPSIVLISKKIKSHQVRLLRSKSLALVGKVV
jgi:hypothetical protein